MPKNASSIRVHPIEQSIAIRNILMCFRRCGRGILKGAAFRQRPLSRFLINFLAGTRKLPPEEPHGKLPDDILAIHKLDFFGKGGKPSLIFRLFQRLHSVCRVILRGHRKKEAEL